MSLVLHDTLAREKRLFEPPRSRAGDALCLRTDGLQLRPHRQRPPGGGVRRAVPRAAPPPTARPAVVYAAQRHRRGRQDQRQRPRPRACRSPSITDRFAAIYQADMAALGALPPHPRSRAPPPTHRPRCVEPDRPAGRPTAPPMPAEGHVLFDTTSLRRLRQAVAAAPLDDMIAGARSRWRPTRRTPPTSCCGSRPSRASRCGTAPGARAGPAGTSSARP